MALKLTVMGQVRQAPTELARAGALLLYPIAPPMRVGDRWAMPAAHVRLFASPADVSDAAALARSVGLGEPTPYAPPRVDSLDAGAHGHFLWPVAPDVTRLDLVELEDETGIVLRIYFVANEPRMRIGTAGPRESEVDCGFAVGSTGVATATWDLGRGRTSLTFCAATGSGFRISATGGKPLQSSKSRQPPPSNDVN